MWSEEELGAIVCQLSPLELEPARGLARLAPRPAAQQQADYQDEFDASTVLYDAFRSFDGDWVVLLGPPLCNLEPAVVPALLSAFGGKSSAMAGLRRRLGIPGGTQVLSADRHTQLWIKSECDQVELPAGLFKQQLLQVRSNSHALFQGKNVIVTMSRNNELAWIGDWVRFHVETHGCNAVLLYDNASTNCRGAEIKDQIVSVRGIDAALVVDWPFKLGPGGGPHWVWDSDFGQYGMLEHARHRYLPTASAVLNVDIDELVLTTAGSSIFDLARRSDVGYVRFAGRWVENATSLMLNPPARRHKHYFYYRDGPTALPKWAVVPARCPPHAQWRVHDIAAMQPDVVASAAATLRHFKAINTNWKDERWKPEALDPAHHRIDEALVAALRIFEDGPTGARRGQIT